MDDNFNSADEALRDYNAEVFSRDITAEELEDHRHRQMHCGIHLPFPRQRGHLHRRHLHHKDEDDVFEEYGTPSQRVQTILSEPTEYHPLFIEMTELRWRYKELEWRETARWLRFEEHVEQGGKRWSKPYVATLSLYSVFETKSCLANGAVMLDVGANTMDELAEVLVDHLVNDGQLDVEFKGKMKELLLIQRHHLKEKREEDLHSREQKAINTNAWCPNSHKFKVSGAQITDPNLHNHAFTYTSEEKEKPITMVLKGNERFRKKMPDDIEAANIMIAERNFLKNPIVAFVRLKHGVLLGDMAEVLIPTRFLFVMMAPEGYIEKIQAIGRTMGALMADEVFREVSYKAKNRQDILSGVDEFIESVTVLPPAEWDPKIRIEPPQQIPSQEERKMPPIILDEVDLEEEEEKRRHETGLVRTGRLFGGLVDDIKRKLPWYWSDFTDAFAIQSIAAILFLYFATLSPIITFGGLLDLATGGNIAVIESLVAAFISGVLYGFFSGQPLTILNTTGPVLVFEAVTYVFCQEYGLYYLEFRCWIGIWTFVLMVLLVMFECSAYVCYITRFTEENFALLIALVYIYQAVEKMMLIGQANPMETHPNLNKTCVLHEFNSTTLEHNQTNLILNNTYENATQSPKINNCTKYIPDVLLFAAIEFIGTFMFVIFLKSLRTSEFFPFKVRQILSDFAVIIAIALFTIIDDQIGINIPKLYVPDSFTPTRSDRTWFIHPYLKNPWWCIPATIPPAMLATILIYMDQMITAVIINRKENKLKKGPGYHLDLLVLAVTILISSFIGVPWLVAGTVVAITHVNALKMESEVAAPGEKPQFLGIRENRLTQISIFALIGASVGMATILTYIPMPVLFGIFMYMGTSPLSDMHFYQRLLLFLTPIKYQPDYPYLRHIRLWRVHMFTFIQLVCMGGLWIVKLTKAISIGFPFMLVVMVVVRKSLDWVYTQEELKLLDDVMPGARKKKVKNVEGGVAAKPRKFSVVPDKHPTLDINLMEELMRIRKVSTNSITLNWMNGKYIPVDHCRNRTGIIDQLLPEENMNLLTTSEEDENNKKPSELQNDSRV